MPGCLAAALGNFPRLQQKLHAETGLVLLPTEQMATACAQLRTPEQICGFSGCAARLSPARGCAGGSTPCRHPPEMVCPRPMVLGAAGAEGSAQSPINKGFLQTEQVRLGLSVSDSRPARGELLISYILRKDGWYLSSSKSLSRSRPFPNGFGNYLLSYIHLKSSDSITGLLLVG